MSKTSTEIISEWNESAAYWQKHDQTIRALLAPITAALLTDAGIREGDRVLDVAGGTGEPSLAIAEVVCASGSVTCTDAAAEMVAAAQREAQRRGLTNLTFRRCSADELPFADASFEAVVSRLGLMFVPDAKAAVREMLRVVKPGGRLAFAVWGAKELNPFFTIVTEVMARHLLSPPEEEDAPGGFRFAVAGKLAGLLKESGAAEVRERAFEFFMEAPLAPEDFWTVRSEMSDSLRGKLKNLSGGQVAQIAAEVAAAARCFFPDGRMKMPAQVFIVTARRP